MAPIDAIPPLRAHDYAGRDWNVRLKPDPTPKLRMAKAAIRRPSIQKVSIDTPPAPELDAYVPCRDEADGRHE